MMHDKLVGCLTVVGCALAVSADIRVGENQIGWCETPTDATCTESVAVAPQGAFAKIGAGTWTLPYSSIWQASAFGLDVLSGKTKLSFDGAAQSISAPQVLQDAELWVDAAVNTVAGDSGVSAWNDCRETVSAAPYVHPGAVSGNASINPTLVTRNGRTMMYFNGAESGSWMRFETAARPGTALTYSNVKHIFLVADFDTCYTYLLGGNGRHDLSIGSHLDSTTTEQTYWSTSLANSEAIYKAATYVNGERIDGTVTNVGKGLRIIEIACPDLSPSFFSFFNANNMARFMGGDYLGEAVFFTRALTDAERLDVNAYLAKKWLGSAAPASTSLSVASGAEAAVEVKAGEVKSVQVKGSGALEKTGAGTLELNPDSAICRNGGVRVTEGTVKTVNPSVNYDFLSGETVTAAADAKNGVSVTRTGGAAGKAQKLGAGEVRVNVLPQDVGELVVSGGEVSFCGAAKVEPVRGAGAMAATIPNASFEEMVADGHSAETLTKNATARGWTFGNAGNAWYGRPAQIREEKIWMYGTQPYAPFDAPDGEAVLILDGAASISTTVTFPQTGAYELTFRTTTRNGEQTGWRPNFEGMPYDLQLIRGNVTNTVAHFCAFRNNGFRLNRFIVPSVEAGDYVFRIAAVDPNGAHPYGCTNFDDFRLTFVAHDSESVIPVPNGDFERTDFLYDNYTTFSAVPQPSGWTLTQGGIGGTEGGMPDVGAICYGYSRQYNTASARYGNTVLFFCSNGGRVTSDAFHVPAGRYRLRFRGGRWGTGSDWKWHNVSITATPLVSGSVTIAGVKTELTALTVPNNVYASYDFPEVLTVGSDGADVVVSLAQTEEKAGLHLDDVVLVPVRDLVRDGGFESSGAWTIEKPSGTYANVLLYPYAAGQQWYGYSRYEGAYYLMLTGRGIASQEIDFPSAGCYRVSFRVCARYDSSQYRGNSMRLWLEKGGVTNEIAVTRGVTATDFGAYTYLFRVSEAGVWRFGMSGLANADKTLRIDGVMIESADENSLPGIADTTALTVDTGAKVRLDFAGTLPLTKVRLGGKSVSGTIDAVRFPAYVSGPGALYVERKGFALLVR